MTIVEFIEARLAEDETVAKGAMASANDDGIWRRGCRMQHDDGELIFGYEDALAAHVAQDHEGDITVTGTGILIYNEGGHDQNQAAHIARQDPARVLREVAAKRAIVADHAGDHECPTEDSNCGYWPDIDAKARPVHCLVVRNLAFVYGDNPNYDPEWAL